jgi:hypothetical protein
VTLAEAQQHQDRARQRGDWWWVERRDGHYIASGAVPDVSDGARVGELVADTLDELRGRRD